MNRSQRQGDLPEPVRRYFNEVGQMQPPPDLLDGMAAEINDSPQPRRFSPVAAFGLAAAAVVILSVIGYSFVAGPREVGVPSATAEPTAVVGSSTAEPSGLDESPAPIPSLRLPGARGGMAGEYGWTGALGARAGMHKIVAGAPDSQTQLTFAVADDCFAYGTDADPVPVTVAGFDGLYFEPYEDPGVMFMPPPRSVETTGAYALAIGDRTLCVYLTFDPATPQVELESARQVVESIRAQPFGPDGIRISFTLPAGWDTG